MLQDVRLAVRSFRRYPAFAALAAAIVALGRCACRDQEGLIPRGLPHCINLDHRSDLRFSLRISRHWRDYPGVIISCAALPRPGSIPVRLTNSTRAVEI